MDYNRTLIEQSRQLIATARAVVEESRRIRARAQASALRSKRILASTGDGGASAEDREALQREPVRA